MTTTYQTDLELVARVVTGDRAAWASFVDTHQVHIHYALLRTLTRRHHNPSAEDLEDLEADLMLNLAANRFRRLQGYRGQCSLRQWLKVVASNYAIDFLRKQRPTLPLTTLDTNDPILASPQLIDPRPGPDVHIAHQELTAQLNTLIRQLNDEDQLFVELYYRREHSFEHVAELMGTTVGAVYARKNRIRKRLKSLAKQAQHESSDHESKGRR